jgi:hypothetical protein
MKFVKPQDGKLWREACDVVKGDTPFNTFQKKMQLDLENFAI